MTDEKAGVRVTRIRGDEPDPDEAMTPEFEDAFEAPARARFVPRLIQIGLPLAAVAVIGGFFAIGSGGRDETPVSVKNLIELKSSGKVTNPRFVGRTENGEPLSLRAAEARPDGLDLNRVELKDVVGEVVMKDGRVVKLTAAKGMYRRSENAVAGEGGVVISTSDGFEFRTKKLTAKLETGEATSETPVVGKAPQGEIRAKRMRLRYSSDKELVAVFDGGVEVTITRVVKSRATGK